MNEQLHYIAELLERVITLLSRAPQIQTPLSQDSSRSSDVRILNLPLPVRLTDATVQAILNEPITVEAQQLGDWSVAINNTPNVIIANQPIQVVMNTPLRKYAHINLSAAGDTTVVSAVSGKRIRVVAYALVSSGNVNVQFKSGTTNLTGSMRLVEAGGIAHTFDGGLFQTEVGQPLTINLSANVAVGGYVVYEEVSP